MIILNPYTVFGKPGVLVTVMFAFYAFWHGIPKDFAKIFLIPASILLLISFFGVLSSIVNGITQLNHLSVMISFIMVLLASYGLSLFVYKSGISKNQLLTIILFSYVLNSIIIIIEINFPQFRSFIEGYLDPISFGTINYSEGFRLRGIATSGGAGLSMGTPVSLVLAIYLFDRKVLNTFIFFAIVSILFFGVLLIGRTGLLLCGIPIVSYFLLLLYRRNLFRLIYATVIAILISPLIYVMTIDYLSEMFGEGYINYAIGFIVNGLDGFQEEGTTSVVIQHLTAIPREFPQIITGYGFYGSGDFYPWTDSGLIRTFLSVGFPLGIFFYLILYWIYLSGFKKDRFLMGNLILLLTIAELKEPLLLTGLSSRMFILILVFSWFNEHIKIKRRSIDS